MGSEGEVGRGVLYNVGFGLKIRYFLVMYFIFCLYHVTKLAALGPEAICYSVYYWSSAIF